MCLLWEGSRTLLIDYIAEQTACSVCACILVTVYTCWRLHCMTLLSVSRGIKITPTGSAKDAYSVLPTPHNVLKGIVFTQHFHFRINIIYIGMRRDKQSCLTFLVSFSLQLLQTKLVFLCCLCEMALQWSKNLITLKQHFKRRYSRFACMNYFSFPPPPGPLLLGRVQKPGSRHRRFGQRLEEVRGGRVS